MSKVYTTNYERIELYRVLMEHFQNVLGMFLNILER